MVVCCQRCQARTLNTHLFCPSCGALIQHSIQGVRLRPIDPLLIRAPRRQPAAPAPCARQAAARRHTTRAGIIGVTALCFSVIFLMGIRHLIAHGGLPPIGIWAIAPVVLGGLLAEEAWVNGHIAAGLTGIIIWAILPWLLAVDQALPWGLIVAVLWALAHAQNVMRWRRSATLSSKPTAAMVVSEKLPP
jgi:hypothetical protein